MREVVGALQRIPSRRDGKIQIGHTVMKRFLYISLAAIAKLRKDLEYQVYKKFFNYSEHFKILKILAQLFYLSIS